jgi:hypothetical protein
MMKVSRIFWIMNIEVNLFEKKPITSLVAEALKRKTDIYDDNQLNLLSY